MTAKEKIQTDYFPLHTLKNLLMSQLALPSFFCFQETTEWISLLCLSRPDVLERTRASKQDYKLDSKSDPWTTIANEMEDSLTHVVDGNNVTHLIPDTFTRTKSIQKRARQERKESKQEKRRKPS